MASPDMNVDNANTVNGQHCINKIDVVDTSENTEESTCRNKAECEDDQKEDTKGGLNEDKTKSEKEAIESSHLSDTDTREAHTLEGTIPDTQIIIHKQNSNEAKEPMIDGQEYRKNATENSDKIEPNLLEGQSNTRRILKGETEIEKQHQTHTSDSQPQNTRMEQDQLQVQRVRSKEASKQLLYNVYGNVISILEEVERRTTKKELPRSDIIIPDQSRKSDRDVMAIAESQLLVFEAQTNACPDTERESVTDELRLKTIKWMAVREDHQIEHKEIDNLVYKLYQILTQGHTMHGFLRDPRPPITEEVMQETFQNIMKGQNDRNVIDESFEKNKLKKAVAPHTRQPESYEHIEHVGRHLFSHNETLNHCFKSDISQMSSSLR